MWKGASALFCLAFVLLRQVAQTPAQQLHCHPFEKHCVTTAHYRVHQVRALAAFLFVHNPSRAFNPSSPAARSSVLGKSRIARRMPRVRLQFDPTLPRPGEVVPKKDTVLRGLKVVKVTTEGVYCTVDPRTGLQGFIFRNALDDGYVKECEKTFFVGDTIDVWVIGLGFMSGKLLLSRKVLMEKEGHEKHTLPKDGRVQPVRFRHRQDGQPYAVPADEEEEEAEPEEQPVDPSIPAPGVSVPPAGTIVRGVKIVAISQKTSTTAGVYVTLDESASLQAFIARSALELDYFKEIEETFRVGDEIDVKVMGLSPISGRLLANRRELMLEEGREKHRLPDDGRVLPADNRTAWSYRGWSWSPQEVREEPSWVARVREGVANNETLEFEEAPDIELLKTWYIHPPTWESKAQI